MYNLPMDSKTRPKAKTRLQKTSATGIASDSVTLSVRLTTDERNLLAEAATLRGWTPTNLLRVASLERAAQILNTSRPTKVPFVQWASQLAALICGPRAIEAQPDAFEPSSWTGSLEELLELFGARIPDHFQYRYTPPPLSPNEVQSLGDAVRLGGPEFLNQVLTECARLLTPLDPAQALPDPIDPKSFS